MRNSIDDSDLGVDLDRRDETNTRTNSESRSRTKSAFKSRFLDYAGQLLRWRYQLHRGYVYEMR